MTARNRSARLRIACRRLASALVPPLVAAVLMLGVAPVRALDPEKSIFQYNCHTWTRHSGLPADKVDAITQTRDGRLWLGTQHGLVHFNGQEFKTVPIDLPEARGKAVRSFHRSRAGGFWFTVRDGGFGRFDGKNFFAISDPRWNDPDMIATAVLETGDGSLWTGSYLGLGRWVKANPAASFLDETGVGVPLSFAEDSSKRIWIGTTEEGLFVRTGEHLSHVPDAALKAQNVFALAADRRGRIWVGHDHGLRCLDEHGRPVAIPEFTPEVKALLVDRHGVLWIGTTEMGLARFHKGQFTHLTKADGLAGDNITALFEDAEGSLWVGTQDGLSQLYDVKFPIFSAKDGFCRGTSHTTGAGPDGALWATFSTGVSRFDGTNVQNFTNPGLFSNAYIKIGFPARDGTAYLVDGDKNICVLSPDGRMLHRLAQTDWPTAFTEDSESVIVSLGAGRLFRIKNGELKPMELQEASPELYWINSMIAARDSAIWIASNNGLFRLKDGRFQQWSSVNGVSMKRTQCLLEDEDGNVWVGLATGLCRIENNEAKIVVRENGLDDARIYSVVPDDHGFFWMATGGGILRVPRQMLNDFLDGRLPRIQCAVFDGLESLKFNDRTDQEYSGCKTPDGRIWFPNPQGVVMIDPADHHTNSVPPALNIEEVLVNGARVDNWDAPLRPPAVRQMEIKFAALSYVSPGKIKVRYRLEGFEPDWVEAGSRRSVTYNELRPGNYTFRVRACNADGVWNNAGPTLRLNVPLPFYNTVWFRSLCGLVFVAGLFGVYRWKVCLMEGREQKLKAANDLLEARVGARTGELAKANESLQAEIAGHMATERELKLRTELLEKEVAERTRMQQEIERVHQELLDISRQAGMAEVATGILHNVGNVLNSVNVSASLITDRIKKSRLTNVGRVAALMREHNGSLGDFITNDPKGQRIPAFLEDLGKHLAAEQASALEELAGLNKNIEHIKEIVTMQQSYAKVSGVTQTIKVVELVDDALRMNEPSLNRHDVELVREFEPDLPAITVDKHKVMQILVNLIRNAKFACDESHRDDKRVIVQIKNVAGGVEVSVIDNGIGIPAENLQRIFNHGFTTRKNGHGFGLHSGALAAKELGGELTVESEGPGKGATFTVRLPKDPPGLRAAQRPHARPTVENPAR